jgi:toxin HigB-1
MIQSFRHRGLRRLYEKGDRRQLRPDQLDKIERILARLDEADEVGQMDLLSGCIRSRAIWRGSGL